MMIKKRLARDIAVLSTAAMMSMNSMANWALEEVVVTAQKRSESVQDVPVAISAFSDEMVSSTGADEVGDIIGMIPGLTGSTSGSGSLNFFSIRGIASTDFTIGSEPSVGVYLNDGYVGRNVHSSTAFYDVDRIEVVKGPQGTLFGRNAAAGAISIHTKKPEEENTLQIGIGAGNEGQEEYDLIGNLAVSDTLAFRLAYHGTRLEGIYEDVVSGNDARIDRDSVRLSTLWNPTDTFEAFLTLEYNDSETGIYGGSYNANLQPLNDPGTVGVGAGNTYPDEIGLSEPNDENIRTQGANLKLSWDFSDDMTLTSVTDYRSFDVDLFFDLDGSNANTFLGTQLLGAPIPLSLRFDRPDVDQESFGQEFRLNGSTDSVEWFVGASYFREDVSDTTIASIIDIAGTGLLPTGGDLHDTTRSKGKAESFGVYGDLTWSFADAWSLTTGIRWSQDEKEWCTSTESQSLQLVTVSTPFGALCDTEQWSEVTPRVVIDHQLTDDILVYASVSKGYKGGGFNAPTESTDLTNDVIIDAATQAFITTRAVREAGAGELAVITGEEVSSFDPETVLAYELGMKGVFMDGQLQFNAATFFNDFKDLQIQNQTVEGIVTRNAAEAETFGIETDFVYAVTDNLVLIGNYTYVDSEYIDGVVNGIDLSGKDLTYAPQNTFSLSASYDIEFSDGGLNIFTVYNWQDEFHNGIFNQANLEEPSYGVWNAKMTYRPSSEAWDASFSIDNIDDEDYSTVRQDINIGLGETHYRGMPRLWKVNVNAYF